MESEKAGADRRIQKKIQGGVTQETEIFETEIIEIAGSRLDGFLEQMSLCA